MEEEGMDDGSVSATVWLKEMREMRREQQQEREHQTVAFVGALDKLGDRMDKNLADLRVEMRRHLSVLVVTFILSFLIIGGIAGVGVYFKGLGITATTQEQATTVPEVAPPVEPPSTVATAAEPVASHP
jgi:hypothetical protein